MGNGVSSALFSKSKHRKVLELGVSYNYIFDTTCNAYTEQFKMVIRLWSVVKNEYGDLIEIRNEYYNMTASLNSQDVTAEWVDNQIRCILETTQIDFSEFQSLDLEYDSFARTEGITIERSSEKDLKTLCNSYLKPWITEDNECTSSVKSSHGF